MKSIWWVVLFQWTVSGFFALCCVFAADCSQTCVAAIQRVVTEDVRLAELVRLQKISDINQREHRESQKACWPSSRMREATASSWAVNEFEKLACEHD